MKLARAFLINIEHFVLVLEEKITLEGVLDMLSHALETAWEYRPKNYIPDIVLHSAMGLLYAVL